MSERRLNVRTKFESRVKITHPVHGEEIVRTGDVSDGGIYVRAGNIPMALGEIVTVQIQDVPGDAPIIRMRVMRCDSRGYGLRFADAE
jgi:PilZ domain